MDNTREMQARAIQGVIVGATKECSLNKIIKNNEVEIVRVLGGSHGPVKDKVENVRVHADQVRTASRKSQARRVNTMTNAGR